MAVDCFLDAAAENFVFVACGAATRQAHADQAVLAIVAVFGDEFLSGAATFTGQVAIGVVIVVAVALHEQAIAFDVGEIRNGQDILSEQVTCRIMGEALWHGAAHADQAIQRVVLITTVAFAAVVFDFSEQKTRIIVAIAQLAAVGVDAAADDVQVVAVFVYGKL